MLIFVDRALEQSMDPNDGGGEVVNVAVEQGRWQTVITIREPYLALIRTRPGFEIKVGDTLRVESRELFPRDLLVGRHEGLKHLVMDVIEHVEKAGSESTVPLSMWLETAPRFDAGKHNKEGGRKMSVTVTITDHHRRKLMELGRGNVSDGVRRLLDGEL